MTSVSFCLRPAGNHATVKKAISSLTEAHAHISTTMQTQAIGLCTHVDNSQLSLL